MLKCECADHACHRSGQCLMPAELVVRRIDMDDATGTPMCRACGFDALDSGLFEVMFDQTQTVQMGLKNID